jgi:hypothetical protein
MTENSFKEQLSVAANRLGLKISSNEVRHKHSQRSKRSKSKCKNLTQKDTHSFLELALCRKYLNFDILKYEDKLRITRAWADLGKNKTEKNITYYYSEIDKFRKMIDDLKREKAINNETAFYSYVGYLKGSKLNCKLSIPFVESFIKTAASGYFQTDNPILYIDTLQRYLNAVEYEKFEKLRITTQNAIHDERLKDRRNKARNELLAFKYRVNEIFRELDSIPLIFRHPDIDNDDIRLSLLWSQKPILCNKEVINEIIKIENFLNLYSKNYDIGRLLSARIAEKVAISFYRHYGFIVKDISIKQLNIGENFNDWKFYDLDVQGYSLIDVKNSRRSKNSQNRYVEHCVKRFKDTNAIHKVRISGILSNYLWVENMLYRDNDSINTDIIFLGETDSEKLQQLKSFFEDDRLILDFSRPNDKQHFFLPPWVFELPPFVYNNRDKIIERIQQIELPDVSIWKDSEFSPISIMFYKNFDIKMFYGEYQPQCWEINLYNKILNLFQIEMISLPSIFLTILKDFIDNIHSSKMDKYSPQRYNKFLYFDSNSPKKYPLFVCDHLETIDELITSLSILWDGNHDLIKRFNRFRLVNYNILQGQESDQGAWKTLIAYCGGWTENGKCGKNPLVLGNQFHCLECGKLICDICGFCSNRCPELTLRKSKIEKSFN